MADRGGIEGKSAAGLLARLRGLAPAAASAGDAVGRMDSIAARQLLWGEGFVTPGGRDEVLALVAPLMLKPGMSLLDVTAGIGGAVRALAEEFRIEAVGLERDLELAQIGMALSQERGHAKRAPVSVYDPDSFDLLPARYDAVLARDATHGIREKERFWRVVIEGLRYQGGVAATEFVRDGGPPAASPAPPLWTEAQYVDCLKSLGFELREVADATRDYRALVLAGWTRLMQLPELRRLPRQAFGPIIDEAERSMRTMQALDNGTLRRIRFHAVAR